ncbi:multiple epidermal growth factor-like domains protein 10 [Mya arenaria]|uniref:multiple epidermal growth factor-like domains protein 10 n=1 Tax=Mya arenaria TaxID=6604 RepID=UPI0022E0A46B|nr:multiple epidermal growth factor-like domains protein 10 [Mya arenaria]
MESTYWLLAVAVVMSMSYVSVEGTPGSNCTGNAKSCADNETCSDPTCVTREYNDGCLFPVKCLFGLLASDTCGHSMKCVCVATFSVYVKISSNGSCTWGNLGDKGVCDNTTGKCACTTGYSWEAEKCKANGYGHACTANEDCKSGNLGDKGVCDTTTRKCACITGYSWEAEKCAANGYNHTCSNENDCQSGNLGDKGVCDNTTKMCDCNDSYSWKGDNCTANGYNDACNTTPDCQLGSLGENGTCNIATKMCHCKDGFFWEVDMCKANGNGIYFIYKV